MELKVWCEGIQRVVCGVSDGTTCHDVVVALAQALGRAGRYTLVEKWREAERLVAPDEIPLLILSNLGEYANDVQFILRHSDNRKSRTGSLLPESRSSSTSSLKKSLTFSGAHSRSASLNSRPRQRPGVTVQKHTVQTPAASSSLESLTERTLSSNSSSFERRRTGGDSLSSQASSSIMTPLERTRKRVTNLSSSSSSSSRGRPSPPSLHKLPKESNNNIVDFSVPVVAEEGGGAEKRRREMVETVGERAEALRRLEREVEQVDSEVSSCERAADLRDARLLADLTKTEADLDSDLQDLELVSWADKLDMEREKERRLRAEISAVTARVGECEGETGRQNRLAKTLSADLSAAQQAATDRLKDAEEKTRQEIADIHRQLTAQTVRLEESQGSEGRVSAELASVAEQIARRVEQIAELERDLKDANMEQFTRAPATGGGKGTPGWTRSSHEGASLFSRPASTRPGSARRLESPQRLKEAVPTARNPQGLWV